MPREKCVQKGAFVAKFGDLWRNSAFFVAKFGDFDESKVKNGRLSYLRRTLDEAQEGNC